MLLWKNCAKNSAIVINWLRYRFAKRENKAQLTQQEFADLIGVSRSAVSNYEKRRRVPDKNIRRRIIEIAAKCRIKIKMADFDFNLKNIDKIKIKITKHIEKYWDKMKKKNPIFRAFQFLKTSNDIYEETGRRFCDNFPFPDCKNE